MCFKVLPFPVSHYFCAIFYTKLSSITLKNFQNMSKKLFLLPALILGAFLIFTPSCGDEADCSKVDCGANGVCDAGVCDCDPGYELGADEKCSVQTRTKIVGNYLVNETCSNSGTAPAYNVTIGNGTADDEISFLGFYGPAAQGGFIAPVKTTVDGTTITIARQEPDNDDIFVEGTGTFSTAGAATILTITYRVTDETVTPIITNQCNNVVFTKQ